MADESENIKNFLEDLRKITIKHKLSINGCGCCGSPFLDTISDESGHYITVDGDCLEWESENE